MKKFLLSAVAFFALTNLCLANNQPSFGVFPAYPNKIKPNQLSFEIKPGDTKQEEVKVSNSGDQPITITLYAVEQTTSQNGQLAFKLPENKKENIGNWITFDSPEITMNPHSDTNVVVHVNVPQNAKKKDYLVGVAFETKNIGTVNKDAFNIGVNFRKIVVANVKVTDNPQPIEKAPLPSFFDQHATQIYFGASLVVFLVALGIFLANIHRNRKKAKTAHHAAGEHTGHESSSHHHTEK